MSRIEKRIERLRNSQTNVSVSELLSIAQSLGLSTKEGSKHTMVFRDDECPIQVPIPRHKRDVNPLYVSQFLDLVDWVE